MQATEMIQIKHDQKEPSDEPWVYIAEDGSQDRDVIEAIADTIRIEKEEEIKETLEDIKEMMNGTPEKIIGVLTCARAEKLMDWYYACDLSPITKRDILIKGSGYTLPEIELKACDGHNPKYPIVISDDSM